MVNKNNPSLGSLFFIFPLLQTNLWRDNFVQKLDILKKSLFRLEDSVTLGLQQI